jgi:hypothetical protein
MKQGSEVAPQQANAVANPQEGEELETNILRVLLRKCAKYCEAVRRQKCGLNDALAAVVKQEARPGRRCHPRTQTPGANESTSV